MAKGKKNPSKKAGRMTSMENFLTAFESGVEHAAAKLTAMNYDVKMDRHEEAEEAHPTNNLIAASPGWLLVSVKNGVTQRWPIVAWNIPDYGNDIISCPEPISIVHNVFGKLGKDDCETAVIMPNGKCYSHGDFRTYENEAEWLLDRWTNKSIMKAKSNV